MVTTQSSRRTSTTRSFSPALGSRGASRTTASRTFVPSRVTAFLIAGGGCGFGYRIALIWALRSGVIALSSPSHRRPGQFDQSKQLPLGVELAAQLPL